MSKKIETYQDLLDEQAKLEKLLAAQQELLRVDFQALKDDFRPALNTVNTFSKLFTRRKDDTLLGAGTERVIDFVFNKFVLNKAGWLARFVIPILAKNVSSHIVADNRDNWLTRLRQFIGRKNSNGNTPPAADPASATPGTNPE
jgi:hypothetical protein